MDSEKVKQTIGRDVFVSLPELGLDQVPCKVDTGAYGCSLNGTCVEQEDGSLQVTISIYPGDKTTHTFTEFEQKKVKSSSGKMLVRYKVKTPIEIEGIKMKATFTFSDRSGLIYPALIGRKVLTSRFVVDPQLSTVDKKELAQKRKADMNLEELEEK